MLNHGDTTNISKVTCLDYMYKFDVLYESELDYDSGSVTIKDVLDEVCSICDVELATSSIANGSFIVDSNQFEVDDTCRKVIKAVAGISGSFAKIKNDNKLYFITPPILVSKKYTVKEIHRMSVADLNNIDNLIIQNIASNLAILNIEKYSVHDVDTTDNGEITDADVIKFTTGNSTLLPNVIYRSDYSELELKRRTHPINTVSLGMSNVEGENITLSDSTAVEEDGENLLAIYDNPFAYTQAKREELIPAIYNKVLGFNYQAYEYKGQAKFYMETGDTVWIIDSNGSAIQSLLFRFTYKSPNGLESEISAPSIIKSTVNYQNDPDELNRLKRTEIIVDKQQGTIDALVKDTTTNTNNINELQITSETTTNKIEEIQSDYTDKIAILQSSIDGLKEEVSTKGGGNILYYGNENYDKQINEIQTTEIRQNSVSGLGYELVAGTATQKQQIMNSDYTISFKYKVSNNLVYSYVIINGETIRLPYTEGEWVEFVKTIKVSDSNISVGFKTDTNRSTYIADLMCNIGTDALTWEQNANETITDTVRIGKGVQVNSSTSGTYTRMDSDGTRIYNSNTGDVTTEFTAEGTNTEKLTTNKAEIAGILIQQVGSQTWISSLL